MALCGWLCARVTSWKLFPFIVAAALVSYLPIVWLQSSWNTSLAREFVLHTAGKFECGPITPADVDAVVFWVNGSDPWYGQVVRQMARSNYLVRSDPEVGGSKRFQEHGELYFTVRSIILHAQFVRRVVIVVNGRQLPNWLLNHPRNELDAGVKVFNFTAKFSTSGARRMPIWVVPHSVLFPSARDLPTLNTFAIRTTVVYIPCSSPFLLLFDDDSFLVKPISRDFFFSSGGGQLLFEQSELTIRSYKDPFANTEWQALASANQQLSRHFGVDVEGHYPHHCPLLFDRAILLELEFYFHSALERTRQNRFRTSSDVDIRYLHNEYVWRRQPTRHNPFLLLAELDSNRDGVVSGNEHEHFLKFAGKKCLQHSCNLTQPWSPVTVGCEGLLACAWKEREKRRRTVKEVPADCEVVHLNLLNNWDLQRQRFTQHTFVTVQDEIDASIQNSGSLVRTIDTELHKVLNSLLK